MWACQGLRFGQRFFIAWRPQRHALACFLLWPTFLQSVLVVPSCCSWLFWGPLRPLDWACVAYPVWLAPCCLRGWLTPYISPPGFSFFSSSFYVVCSGYASSLASVDCCGVAWVYSAFPSVLLSTLLGWVPLPVCRVFWVGVFCPLAFTVSSLLNLLLVSTQPLTESRLPRRI